MPDNVRIVSTYNPGNWDAFVKRNILSWLEHTNAELIVYHEENRPGLQHPRLIWRQWQDIPGAADFVDEASRFPPARGRFGSQYDYNYDAWKFSRKVYAQCDAAEEYGDILIWLDSDVEVEKKIEDWEDFLGGMPLARYDRPGYHSETGVVIWDQRHGIIDEFFRIYRHLYDSRSIYRLQNGWHDCWALDFVIDQLGIPTSSLGKSIPVTGPNDLHVVPDSSLGGYLRHDKGGRKPRAA